ncbi:glycosyltransferase family 2 protein [Phragmitibacter flavus]|uniref:Glycosyltransferase family 2 protein n=1 Tax=Phragmitibacter flavus TaxID=2576071 RepID=A0A5R8KDY0_9BACT|nr:glycosyltransferase family 2 protein [Phragmitibacter flavus]TLD70503.1 glycosyltransferase family 2 protein [Phragmitibacter flavus]
MSELRPLVSFVVPLYNTGKALEPLLEAFRDLPIEGGYELVLVNDGSPDGSGARVPALARELPVPVIFVDMARNFGEHAAVLEGFRHARGEYVINLDDDLQNPISEALKLLAHLRATDSDVVYAKYEEKKHSRWRNWGSWFTNKMATWLLDKPPHLYLCSFRAMHRDLVQRVIAYTGPFPYIDGLILGATNRIEELTVAHDERADGSSGYTLRKLVRLWMNMFFNFSIMPLRMASVMGAVLVVFGMVMLLVVFLEHFFSRPQTQGWSSLMAAISIFSGGQLMMLGVIGEYVGRAFMTVSGKPQSIVRRARHFHGKENVNGAAAES